MTHNKSLSGVYYLLALPLVFCTLIYTGVIRRFFYALPIAVLKLIGSRSIPRLCAMIGSFLVLLYTQLLPVPFTYFIERFESLIGHSILRGSGYSFISNAPQESIPTSFAELVNTGVNFWHVELFFPVPMIEYWAFFGLFISAFLLSILVEKLLHL